MRLTRRILNLQLYRLVLLGPIFVCRNPSPHDPPGPPEAENREPDRAGYALPDLPGVDDAVVGVTGASG
jgi:hypothetical protein